MSVTPDSFFVTQGFLECYPKGQPDVFDTVMAVDLKVAFGLDGKIEKSVKCKLLQHVIEKPNAGFNTGLTGPIEVETD